MSGAGRSPVASESRAAQNAAVTSVPSRSGSKLKTSEKEKSDAQSKSDASGASAKSENEEHKKSVEMTQVMNEDDNDEEEKQDQEQGPPSSDDEGRESFSETIQFSSDDENMDVSTGYFRGTYDLGRSTEAAIALGSTTLGDEETGEGAAFSGMSHNMNGSSSMEGNDHARRAADTALSGSEAGRRTQNTTIADNDDDRAAAAAFEAAEQRQWGIPTDWIGERDGTIVDVTDPFESGNVCTRFNCIGVFWTSLLLGCVLWSIIEANWLREKCIILADYTDEYGKGSDNAKSLIIYALAFVNSASLSISSVHIDLRLILACGWLWSAIAGGLWAWFSSGIGASLSWFFARSLIRPFWKSWLNRASLRLRKSGKLKRSEYYYGLLNTSISDYGYLMMFSLRMNPYLPVGLLTYLIGGLTEVSFMQFAVGHLAFLPTVLVFASIGNDQNRAEDLNLEALTRGVGSPNEDAEALVITLTTVSVVCTIISSLIIGSRFLRLKHGETEAEKLLGKLNDVIPQRLTQIDPSQWQRKRTTVDTEFYAEGVIDDESVSVEVGPDLVNVTEDGDNGDDHEIGDDDNDADNTAVSGSDDVVMTSEQDEEGGLQIEGELSQSDAGFLGPQSLADIIKDDSLWKGRDKRSTRDMLLLQYVAYPNQPMVQPRRQTRQGSRR